MLNSAQAVTEDGRIVLGSFSGSQVGPVGGSAGKVILAIGSQKIVPDLAAALGRLEDYCLPSLEAAYGVRSALNKVLILNGDFPGRVTVVLKDVIGI